METITNGNAAIRKKDPKKTKDGRFGIDKINTIPKTARANPANISLFMNNYSNVTY
jgi:hypothetical protein